MSAPIKNNNGSARHSSKCAGYNAIVKLCRQDQNSCEQNKGKYSVGTQNKDGSNTEYVLKPTSTLASTTCYNLRENKEKVCDQESCDTAVQTLCKNEMLSDICQYRHEKSKRCEKVDAKSELHEKQKVKNTLTRQKNNVAELNSKSPQESEDIREHKMTSVITTKTGLHKPSESLTVNSSTNVPANIVETKREMRSIKKKLAKEKKRRQRELEFRKNLEFPMGQRIQVIDHNAFQKLSKDSASSYYENKTSVPNFDEFPKLNLPNHIPKFTTPQCQNASVPPDDIKVEEHDTNSHHLKSVRKISDSYSVATRETKYKNDKQYGVSSKAVSVGSVKKTGKSPKKRDPIQIDILQCIKMVKSKDTAAESRKTQNILEKEKRRTESSVISGNQLDSSNPQRSRGKKREQPKRKKPTRLKLVILHERELRSQLKKLQGCESSQEDQTYVHGDISANVLTLPSSELQFKESDSNRSDAIALGAAVEVAEISKECNYYCKSSITVTNDSVSAGNQFMDAGNGNDSSLEKNINIKSEQLLDDDIGRRPSSCASYVTAGTVKNETHECTSLAKQSCNKSGSYGSGHSTVIANDKNITRLLSDTENHQFCHCSEGDQNHNNFNTYTTPDSQYALKEEENKMYAKVMLFDNSSSQKELNKGKEYLKLNENVSIDIAGSSSSEKENQFSDSVGTEIRKNSETMQKSVQDVQKTVIHSRKFRPYCDHFITPEINSFVKALVQDIVKFHDRQYERDPVKANARRRHVTGLREVLKYLNLKRLKLIIIAPDMELVQSKGGICDIVEQIKEGARNQEIPYVFALHRRALGNITIKKVPVSCIGVISYDGTEKNFHSLIDALSLAKSQYQEALKMADEDKCAEEDDVNKQVVASMLSKLTENVATSVIDQSLLFSEAAQKREE